MSMLVRALSASLMKGKDPAFEAGLLHAVIDLTEDDPPIQQLFKAPIFSAFWQVRASKASSSARSLSYDSGQHALPHTAFTRLCPPMRLHRLRESWLLQGRLIPGARIDSLPFIEVHLLSSSGTLPAGTTQLVCSC